MIPGGSTGKGSSNRISSGPTWGCLTLCLVLMIPSAVQGQASLSDDLPDVEKLYGLSLFWQEANYNFAFFDQVPDLDWDAAYREFIPRVLSTHSTWESFWAALSMRSETSSSTSDGGAPG